jgi:hypothetical protein
VKENYVIDKKKEKFEIFKKLKVPTGFLVLLLVSLVSFLSFFRCNDEKSFLLVSRFLNHTSLSRSGNIGLKIPVCLFSTISDENRDTFSIY